MCAYVVGGDSPGTVFKLQQSRWPISYWGGVSLVMVVGICFLNEGMIFRGYG